MDWADTPEQATFRQQVKDVIEAKLPGFYKDQLEKGLEDPGGWIGDRNLRRRRTEFRRRGVGRRHLRRGLVRSPLAEGVRRRRPLADGAVHLQHGDGRSGRAQRRRRRRVAPRPDDHRARHRRAEGEAPLRHPLRRGRLGAGLLRAGRWLGPRGRCRPAPPATATSSWSTARRSGPRARSSRTSCSRSCAPTRTRRSTAASRSCCSTTSTVAGPERCGR